MLGLELNNMLTQIHEMEKIAKETSSFIESNIDEVAQTADFTVMLEDLKKKVIRSTMSNIVNIIDRVVEDGSKNIEGENKQYNVNSVQVTSDDSIFLVTREVLGIDLIDKKYILDSDLSYIDFNTVVKIY